MSITARNYAVTSEPHKAFPIADFQNALFLAREPWMSPANAFRRVENAKAFRGQIVKRDGFDIFAELAAGTSDTRVIKTSASGSGVNRSSLFSLSLANRPVPESVRFDDNSGVAAALIYATLANRRQHTVFTDNDAWLWDVVAEGTSTVIGTAVLILVGVSAGWQANVYWHTHPDFSAQSADEGYVSYRVNAQSEIVGLYRFKTGSGDYSIACDPDYVYRYNLTTEYYQRQGFDGSFAGPFTGTNSDYFWFWPVDGYVVMTNNVDPVCKWDPALAAADSVVEMDTDWTTPGTNALDTCLLVVAFAGRLVYLNTLESTTRYPTRARWTEAGSASSFRSPLDYADAPLDKGAIVTAQFIGERLFVGFELGWMELVRRPGDEIQAFEWRPHISRFGAVSKLSTIQDSERLLSRSATSMQAVDPNGQTYLDVQIPDLVLDFSVQYKGLCAGTRSEIDRSFLWTYTSREDSKPGNVLCAVYDEKGMLAWSQYAMSFNVFSDFEQEGVLTWDDLAPGVLDSFVAGPLDSYGGGSDGKARIIAGQSKGMVYILGRSTTDVYHDGIESIEMLLETQNLQFFPGQRAHFGWLDLFVETSLDAEIRLTFYADENATPYLTKTVTLSPTVSSGKVRKRVSVGRTATFHRFKIETLDDQPIAIDGLEPYCRPAGRARNF